MKLKKLVSVFLSVAMIFSIVGCGGNTGSGSDTKSTANSDDGTAKEQGVESDGEETAGGEEGTNDGPKYGGVLRIALPYTAAVSGYTPEMANNAYLEYLCVAYESLTYYDEEGNICPRLATSWESDPEEPSVTWHLRDDVQFADGTPFNAEAVKVNIEEYQKCGRNETSNISSCEVVDEYTVKMLLNDWNSATVEMVGFFVYYMSPEALKDVDALRGSSCGTGPFQVTSFESGVKVSYAKNENYWQEGKPYLDGVEIQYVGENSTRASAFKAGEYDVTIVGDMVLAQQFMNDDTYVQLENGNGQGVALTGLIPNSAKEGSPFADARVRQAMCYAIDVDTLIKTFGYGFMTTTNQWALPEAVTYNEEVQGYPYNPEKAKELLAEAGYPDGFDTVMTTGGGNKDMFTAAAAMLDEVGIRCEVNIVDGPTEISMYMDGEWDGLMGHYHAISPDLGLYMGRHLDYDGAYYAKGIQHPDEAMELLQAVRKAKTDEEKIQLEHQLQKVIYDDLALFGKPLYSGATLKFKYNYVMDDGFCVHHVNTGNLEDCWLNK